MRVKSYLPALVCALTPILCYLLVRPFAEIGIDDDWSYVKTAQVFAQTGKFAYFGLISPMLGWHVQLGALFIKLFGFSFTVVRLSTLIEAVLTAFLLQRTFVRAGMNAWNGTLATVAFVLSPLFLPLSFTFMSDVPGVLCIVVCLYMCLRALGAENEGYAMTWISLAALLNAVGGTARQFAWLGLLVMVPATLWLLRRNRRVLVVGCLSCIAGVGIVAGAIHWFAQQPYAFPESPIPGRMDLKSLRDAGEAGVRLAGELALLALPVSLMFVGSLRALNRRLAVVIAAVFFCFTLSGIVLIEAGRMHHWLAPFYGGSMTDPAFERLDAIVTGGAHLAIARLRFRFFLTAATMAGVLSFAAQFLPGASGRPESQRKAGPISWKKLGVLLGPFSAAYIILLVSIALRRELYDRYLLPLLAVLLLALTCCYQQKVREKLPLAGVLLIAIFGAFSVAATHDRFALYRGYASAIDEIRASGIPATSIVGPLEFMEWTEVEEVGHINDSGISNRNGAYVPRPARVFPASCGDDWFLEWAAFLDRAPEIKPAYATSLDPGLCGGYVAFPPVTYRAWIAPHTNLIYAVRLPASFRH
jgi:hypothetical protein